MDLSFHPETKQILRRTTKSPLTLLQLHFVFKIGRSNGVQTNRYHEKGYLKHSKWIQLWNVVIHAWISREFPFPPKKELELVGYVELERLREFQCTFGTFLDHVKCIGLRIPKKKNQTDKIQHIDIRSVFRKWKWVWIPRWFSCWSSPRVFSFPSTRLLLSTTGVVTTNVVHKEVEGDTRKLTTLVAVSRIISKQVKTLSATLRSLWDGIDSQVMLEAKCPYKWYREWDVEQYIQCGWMVPFLQELMELSTTRLASISSA